MDDLVKFLTARLAEDWSAARDRELAAGLDESRGTRDTDAKRAIVAEYVAVRKLQGLTGAEKDGYRDWVLLHLAAVYRDHPDYQQEWKP